MSYVMRASKTGTDVPRRLLIFWLALTALLLAGATTHAQERTRVAVLPFAVSGALEFEGIGSFVPGMLASRMYGLGAFRFVDTVPLMAGDAGAKLGAISADEAAGYARRFGADYVISGAIRRSGGTTVLSAQVYAPDGSGAGNRVVIPVNSPDDLIPKLVPFSEELADRLLEAARKAKAAPAASAPEEQGA